MSGRHGNKRKKKKTQPESARVELVNDALCQEHPDREKEPNMTKTEDKARPPRWYEHKGLTLFVAILAFLASLSQAYFMRQTLRVDQRAWVVVNQESSPVTPTTLKPEAIAMWTVILGNTGKTVARQVELWFVLIDLPYGTDP